MQQALSPSAEVIYASYTKMQRLLRIDVPSGLMLGNSDPYTTTTTTTKKNKK